MNINMNIFSRLRLRERQTAKEAGKGYQVWRLCVPLLSGLVFGYCASVVAGYALDKFSGTAGMSDQAVTGANTAETTESAARGLDEFLAVNLTLLLRRLSRKKSLNRLSRPAHLMMLSCVGLCRV